MLTVTAIFCTRIATLLDSFACIEKVNKIRQSEGSGRDMALNFQGVFAGL